MTWYLVAGVVLGVGALILRRRLVAGPAGLEPTGLTGAEVGYLVGGPRRAVAAVLAGLRINGSITFTHGQVVQAEPAPETWGRLGQVIRIAAAGTSGIRGLLHHRSVQDALAPVRRDLVARGWLLGDERRRTVRQLSVPMWVLAGIGVFITVRAAFDDRPFSWLVVATGAVGYAAIALTGAPELTRGARRALERFTEASDHLSPAANPSLLTYGAAAAAVAVGLYGTNVLMPVDSELALAADLMYLESQAMATRAATSSAGSGSGGGSGGCGGCGGGSGAGDTGGDAGGCGGGCGGCGCGG
jgi:uncharacterized protein (TIGR04222 family)